MAWIFVLFVLVVVGAGVLAYYIRAERIKDVAATARRLGLQFSADDPYGLDRLPFALMQRGDGNGAENVMWGVVGGRSVTLFDFWFYEETRDAQGHTSRSYTRFSCGLAPLPAACPHLTIAHENVLTRIADHLGLQDIQFESEAFNRRFNVKSSDKKFASALVDPPMMEWLMTTSHFEFEVSGRQVLCATGRLRPAELPRLLDVVQGFTVHVPAVVASLYPASGAESPHP